jgi:hypothetical protein
MTARTLLPLFLLGCAYDAPDNPHVDPFPNVISGTVLAGELDEVEHVVLLLADATNPMPPNGTGSPATFSTVPGDWFSDVEAGVRAASYAVTGVPDGTWILTAVMDRDLDFHPAVPTLAGATCGDLAGGHLQSLTSTTFAPITAEGGVEIADITVVLGLQVPTERPAFAVSEVAGTVDPASPLTGIFRLESRGIEASYGPDLSLQLTGPFDPTAPNPCDTAFWVHLRDVDGNGQIDPHPDYPPELGVPDVWPRVYLEWLGEPIDTDGDDVADDFDRGDLPVGTRFVTEGVPYAPQLAAIDPTRPETIPPIGTSFPATTLDVLFPSVGQRLDPDGTATTLVDPAALPAGAWSVTVVAQTGQTWEVPNELDTTLKLSEAVPSPGVTSAADFSQGRWVEVAR